MEFHAPKLAGFSHRNKSNVVPPPEPEEVSATAGIRGDIGIHGNLDHKFTLNLKSSGEISLTVRTDDEGELEQLLEKWEPRIIIIPETNGKTRYYAGDSCPQCSSKLIRRQGKNGKFLGCSAYPDCQFTAPL